ncbi:RNA-binding protein 12 [Portunus trituberculatus]|uniref:RNA-binding protein 12 n=1 Tax=Portunus trituberculatus TaxID=210409 RepID=A0A5B7ILC6_PORTR|nr:RNA-binding protein 12 [Portunus trituberculatus]
MTPYYTTTQALPSPALPYPTLPSPILTYPAFPCPPLPRPALPCPSLPYPAYPNLCKVPVTCGDARLRDRKMR